MGEHTATSTRAAPAERTPAFLQGNGEMAAAIRAFDWSATLGPPSRWPAPLVTLADLMLASGQPMFMAWGPERTWLYNDAFIPILGRKHPQALGRPALEVWSEAREDLSPLFDRVFAGEPVHMQDISLLLDRRGTLEESHFSFSYTPARDTDGCVAGLFGACVETTEQVLADRRALETQERQRKLFQGAPGFIAILNGPRHVFEFFNDSFVRLAGRRELLGLTVREAFPDIEGQGFFELLDSVYASGERFAASHVPVRFGAVREREAEEHYIDFVYAPIHDEAGRVTGIFVEGHDVTETHRVQKELRENQRRQTLLMELSDRVRELDDPADISYAAAEVLGRALNVSRAGYGTVDLASETIVIERDWNAPGIQSLAGTLRFRDYGTYIEDLKRGETVVFANAETDPRTRKHAQALKDISAQSVVNMPVTEHEGLVALLYLNHAGPREWPPDEIAFVREVAERTRTAVERRRAEKDLLDLTASLEQQVAERTEALRQSQKLEAMGQLTGGVAHDFNNLLAVVSNNVYLHRRLSPACEHAKELAAIVRASETGSRLTRHLLTFARRQPIQPEVVRLQRELRELRPVLQVTLGSQIGVSVIADEDAPPVKVDRSELELALLNLAVNARDAMPSGGNLTVHASRCMHEGRPATCIEVRDTGTGIPPDVLPRVLEPFFTTKQPGQGTGLGLSQAYGFARQAGGGLEIASTPGEGTSIAMVLPATTEDVQAAEAASSPREDRLGAQVLLVEDNPEVGATVRELLRVAGCEVTHVTSGHAARDVLEGPRGVGMELVLSDLVMPGPTSGLALAQWIDRERPMLPVLLYSGYSREMAEARNLGFTVLQKPVAPDELLDAVRAGLERRGGRGASRRA